MSQIWFGVPPDVAIPTLLDACGAHAMVERIVVESTVRPGRTLRWMTLFGAESDQPEPLLVDLARAMIALVVVVDGTDEFWRVLTLACDVDRLVATFDRSNQDLPDDAGAPPLRPHLRAYTTAADAEAIDAPLDGWQHHVRGADGAFQPAEPTDPDEPSALDWAEVYDWGPGDGDDDPAADPARALAEVDAELANLGETADDAARSLALFNRSCFLSLLGRLDEALDALTAAVRIGPEHFEDAWRDDDLVALRADPRFGPAITAALDGSNARAIAAAMDERMLRPLSDLDLSMRVTSTLEHIGVELVGDLVQRSVGEVASQLGSRGMNEILEAVRELGLAMGTPSSDWAAARAWRRRHGP